MEYILFILFILSLPFIVLFSFLSRMSRRITDLEKLVKREVEQNTLLKDAPSEDAQEKQPLEQSNKLVDYVNDELGKGVAKEKITDFFVQQGLETSDIEDIFITARKSGLPKKLKTPSVVIHEGPTLSEQFFMWLKEDWLLKLGALLLLIAFGWLTTYAFLNNWIGPMGRIAFGIIAGVLFILLGWWRIKKYIHQGGVFLVMGSTTILLTLYAARSIYDFFTPLSVLVVMFLSTAFVALMSVKYKSRGLALMSLILAGIAPLLTNVPVLDYVEIFSYLLVVTLGAIWVSALMGQRELTVAALILVVFYSLPHLVSFTSADQGMLLLFAYVFAMLFFVTNIANILKAKAKDSTPDLLVALGNGLLLLAWIMTAAQDEFKSLIITAWMLVFAVGAFMVFRITNRKEPFYMYASVSVAMLVAATSAELSGSTLVIAYTIEAAAVAFVSYLIMQDARIAGKISWLLIAPAFMSLGSMASNAWRTGVLHKDFFVLFVLGLTMFVLGQFLWSRTRVTDDKESQKPGVILMVVGSAYGYILLWLSLHAWLQNDNTAVMIALVVYILIGLATYFQGLENNNHGLKMYGGVLVGFVVARLLLIDVWRMDLAGRILTFSVVGVLLMSTAFLGKKKKNSEVSDNVK